VIVLPDGNALFFLDFYTSLKLFMYVHCQ